MGSGIDKPGAPLVRQVLLGAAAYLVAARLGLVFALFQGDVSPVWPPSGVALGLGLVFGPGLALGAALGAVLSDLVTHGGFSLLSPMAGLAAGVECWLGVTLLNARGFDRRMPRVRDVISLLLFGAALPALAAALGGAAVLALSGHVPRAAFLSVARTWWVGDALGSLSFAPVLLAFAKSPRLRWAASAPLELAGAGALLIGSTVGVFLLPQSALLSSGTLVFACVPVLAIVWAALRFDQRTAAGAMLLVASAAILGAADGRGAFAGLPDADRLWLLQLYLMLCSLTAFTVSSLSASNRARHLKLTEQEEQLRRASELTGVGGFSWLKSEPVPRWSPRLHQMFQIPEGEPPLTLQDALGVMLPDDRARYEALLLRIRKQPAPYHFSFSFRRRDGAIRHAQAVAEPRFDGQGKLVQWDGAVQDITEQVDAESRLRAMERSMQQTQRLESLGLLAGGVAHDFNNLLTGILGNVTFAKGSGPQPDALAALEDVEAAVKVAADLCRQLLSFAGRSRMELERVELSALLAEVSRLVSRSIKPGAQLEVEAPAGLPAIAGDPTQLKQVVMNLIINASDALGETGRIRARVEERLVSAEALSGASVKGELVGARCLVLTVEDTGSGMSEETLAQIFNPFFTTKPKGRGLGLAATLGIVHKHGGALAVKSTPGVGTLFTLWFPVSGSAAARPEFHLQGTALVVGDELPSRRAVERLLSAAGVVVHTASTAARARELLATPGGQAFALIDQQLAEGSGVALVRELARAQPRLPCVLMVAAEDAASLELERSGAAAILQQPFTPEGLREAVRRAIAAKGAGDVKAAG